MIKLSPTADQPTENTSEWLKNLLGSNDTLSVQNKNLSVQDASLSVQNTESVRTSVRTTKKSVRTKCERIEFRAYEGTTALINQEVSNRGFEDKSDLIRRAIHFALSNPDFKSNIK